MAAQAITGQESAGFTVSAVARRLGVAPATLRTWDRRYGMSPSLRTAGAHRRYTEADLALLQRMQEFMLSGMPPGDACRAARNGSGAAAEDDSQPGTCAVVPLASSDAQQRGLARAAARMDSEASAVVLRRCIERWGVIWTWDEVIAPVMRSLGERYEQSGSGAGIDIEHHLSHVVMRELIRSTEVTKPANPRPVLLASAADEEHTLPLYALAAGLAERGIATRLLGGRTPDQALASAVRLTGPVAVFIWAQGRATTDLHRAIPDIRPAAAVVVGGPGWQYVDRSGAADYPQSLTEAVASLVAVVRPSRR